MDQLLGVRHPLPRRRARSARVDDLVARSPEEHREAGIDVRLRHEVMAIDLDRGEVEVHDLDAGRRVP